MYTSVQSALRHASGSSAKVTAELLSRDFLQPLFISTRAVCLRPAAAGRPRSLTACLLRWPSLSHSREGTAALATFLQQPSTANVKGVEEEVISRTTTYLRIAFLIP